MLPPLPAAPHEPLYIRLKRALREVIGTAYQPGDRVPSEAALCSHYGLSRITVRAALTALANEGVLERAQGKGSFVARPKRVEDAAHLPGVTEYLSGASPNQDVRIVTFEQVAADPRVAAQLDLDIPASVHKVRRVKAVPDRPKCYQVSYLPESAWPDLTQDALAARGALRPLSHYRLLAESVEATLADRFRANLLGIRSGVPLLVIDRVFADASDRRIEYNRSFYCALEIRLLVSATPSLGGTLAVESLAVGSVR